MSRDNISRGVREGNVWGQGRGYHNNNQHNISGGR